MSGWYRELQAAGFEGVQTPGLPFHISLASFSLDKEKEAAEFVKKLGERFEELPVFAKSFVPFYGKIAGLHLCAFWPTREIVAEKLK